MPILSSHNYGPGIPDSLISLDHTFDLIEDVLLHTLALIIGSVDP